jgi:hypothetical protein
MTTATRLVAIVAVALAAATSTASAAAPTVELTGTPAPVTTARSATFSFVSSTPGALLECSLDAAAFAPCASPTVLTQVAEGAHTFAIRATDPADGAGSSVSFSWTVEAPKAVVTSLEPPPVLRAARAVGGDRRVKLTWARPPARVAAVIVTAVKAGSAPRLVFRGVGTGTTLLGLRNGVELKLALQTVDAAGNRSDPVSLAATPMPPFVGSPAIGARVKAPPLLRWNGLDGSSYFNVQLFRGSRKLLSVWPTTTRLQLRWGWVYDGRWQSLKRGTYTWYVWPGLGPRVDARYGPLFGKQTFVVR